VAAKVEEARVQRLLSVKSPLLRLVLKEQPGRQSFIPTLADSVVGVVRKGDTENDEQATLDDMVPSWRAATQGSLL
jgi:hypothetical protein